MGTIQGEEICVKQNKDTKKSSHKNPRKRVRSSKFNLKRFERQGMKQTGAKKMKVDRRCLESSSDDTSDRDDESVSNSSSVSFDIMCFCREINIGIN